jgi:hypothetical protein
MHCDVKESTAKVDVLPLRKKVEYAPLQDPSFVHISQWPIRIVLRKNADNALDDKNIDGLYLNIFQIRWSKIYASLFFLN